MAHTLTINDQYTGYWAVTVNGSNVTSPYTLQNGDIIKVPTLTQGITINGTSYDFASENVLNISNEDITVVRTGAEKVNDPVPCITINYTESATLTFKHFYDAGTIGTGTYKFRHYSQQEPSSGETWALNEQLSFTAINETVTFVSNNKTYHSFNIVEEGKNMYLKYDDEVVYSYADWSWSNTAYRTITLSASPTGDLLTWLQANGVKQ